MFYQRYPMQELYSHLQLLKATTVDRDWMMISRWYAQCLAENIWDHVLLGFIKQQHVIKENTLHTSHHKRKQHIIKCDIKCIAPEIQFVWAFNPFFERIQTSKIIGAGFTEIWTWSRMRALKSLARPWVYFWVYHHCQCHVIPDKIKKTHI